jgi:hypothetical protein
VDMAKNARLKIRNLSKRRFGAGGNGGAGCAGGASGEDSCSI